MRRRIVICLGLLLAVCLVGDAIAMWGLYRSIGQLRTLADFHRIQAMRTNLASNSVRIERDLLGRLAGHKHAKEEHADSMRRFEESLQRCGSCHHAPAVRAKLNRIEDAFHVYWETAGPFFADGNTENGEELRQNVQDRADDLVKRTTAMVDEAAVHLSINSADVAVSVRNAWVVLSMTLTAALVFGGIVAFHLKRRLTEPVEALLEGIEQARHGDLTHRISIEADEEFRVLADAFNRAYEDLGNAHDSVLQAEKMAAVGQLAAGVAHEVGNPLASISSIAQMMRRHSDSDEQAEQLQLIMEQITRISRIVRDLLTFSRPVTDTRHDPIEIGEVLERASTLIGYDKRARNIRIVCRPDEDLGPVRADADRLLLVFTNIMINALDAISAREDRSGTLTITARQEGASVVVRFEDNGSGMSKKQIANAFEPFFTTKGPSAGTGLGLWICYQVIQRHNGTIRIDSSAGKGATVTIELPCEPVPSAVA